MQFLRTAFWVVLVIIIMIFTVTNWTPVSINLWSGKQLVTKLPVLVIVAFLAGSLPFWALHKATRWRLRRKLDNAERALAAAVPAAYPASEPAAPALTPAPPPPPAAEPPPIRPAPNPGEL
ncbi:MAG: hypothetical protein BGP16_17325 [Sphingobium sp. 66-54]|nr:MAG: hypothetical protein BGP16_17325 [Sphingobium sp. 66-54]